MNLALLLSIQAAAAGAPTGAAPMPVDFDLSRYKAPEPGCGDASGAEILVCGRRPDGGDYPFEAMERIFRDKPLVAEIGIGGGAKARAYTEGVALPNGMISKRIMIGVKVPF